jgi:predicted DNA-binding transcriptional regulator AlpA
MIFSNMPNVDDSSAKVNQLQLTEILDRLRKLESMIIQLHQVMSSETNEEHSSELMTAKQTAKFLDLTIPTIYSMTCRKELPFIKKAKRIYFLRSELLNYLQSDKSKTTEELSANAHKLLKK